MYIVSRDKRSIINTEQITSMYVGADGCTIKADFENGKAVRLDGTILSANVRPLLR